MKKTYLIILCILCFCLSGCSSKEVDESTVSVKGENQVYIFYPGESDILIADEVYQIKQPDSIVASVEEVMSVSLDSYDGKLLNYSYMIDDDNKVTLDVTVDGECTREYSLLTMTAITDTLFQIESVENVKITLLNSNGEQIDSKLILRNTFYHYDTTGNVETKRITFYKANGEGLEGLSGSVEVEDYSSVIENIVIELEAIDAIPKGTEVNSVALVSGICYVDLSCEFEDTLPGVKSELVVYSLVNSVTSLSYVNSVLITIDGQVVESYRGTVDLSKPFSFNKDLIK